ncbi:hypothetical protein K438DRAFT_679634 [Mycena galopus ATCC 62051]|nr:hypothetical protein K438DRAFT_679634 [Mycena galopus ATCC 62051]
MVTTGTVVMVLLVVSITVAATVFIAVCKIVGGHAFWSQNAIVKPPASEPHISTSTLQNMVNPYIIQIPSSSSRAPREPFCILTTSSPA